MIPFNFHHLFYFYTIAELGSVSKAADRLHISQPALSAQVKQLERYLRVKLFERDGKRLVLTAEGRSALEYAKVIFDTGREFIDNFQDRAERGRLRIQIGVSQSIAKIFTLKLIETTLSLNFQARLVLHKDSPAQLERELMNHNFDLVLSDTPLQTSAEEAVSNHLIGKIPVVFCGHSKLLKKERSLIKALQTMPVILPTVQSQIFNAVQEYFAAIKVTPVIAAEVNDVELIHRMVLGGLGIAPLNRIAVEQAPFRESLVILEQKPVHDIHNAVYLIAKRRQFQHPLVEKIITHFKRKLN